MLRLARHGLVQRYFTYIAGLVAKPPNSGRINPVKMAWLFFEIMRGADY